MTSYKKRIQNQMRESEQTTGNPLPRRKDEREK